MPPNGRTDNHAFNDILYQLIFEAMAQQSWQRGDTYLAGQYRRRRMSNYKQQLLEKQKLVAQYNIQENQMVNYFRTATSQEGYTIDRLIQQLETRLDATVLRGGLSRTIYQARQLVSHGHIQVNGNKVDIPSNQVEIGDKISVRENSRKIEAFTDALQNANPPDYLDLSKPEMTVEFVRLPERDEVPAECDVPQVVEFYSR